MWQAITFLKLFSRQQIWTWRTIYYCRNRRSALLSKLFDKAQSKTFGRTRFPFLSCSSHFRINQNINYMPDPLHSAKLSAPPYLFSNTNSSHRTELDWKQATSPRPSGQQWNGVDCETFRLWQFDYCPLQHEHSFSEIGNWKKNIVSRSSQYTYPEPLTTSDRDAQQEVHESRPNGQDKC